MKEVIYYESKKYKIINNTDKTKNYDSNIISKTKKSTIVKNETVKIKNKEKHDINFGIKEKDLLKEYSLKSLDNTLFTTILADDSKKNPKIQANKLQVIIEFLFFMRNDSIDIIHLL